MKSAIVLICILLGGCVGQTVTAQTPAASPQVVTSDQAAPQRERLTLKLTLSSPTDLKVREGDRVMAGDLISDRTRDRERLLAEKAQLQIKIDRLRQPIPGPPPARRIPEMAALPPTSFVDELAAVERQRVAVETARQAVVQQQRMLDLLSSTPSGNLPEETIPHEQEKLKQLQQAVTQAESELRFAEAQLAQAQAERQHDEYLHSLEQSKRAIALEQQQLERQNQLQRQQEAESTRQFQLAELEAKMQQLEMQLLSLATVRSPFSGRIQRISWEGQNDQNLVVELVLLADSGPSSDGTKPTSGSGGE